jgi:hypothetical protein
MRMRRVCKDSSTAVKSKNADGSEGFIKTPTRRREAEPTFDFLLPSHL